MLVSAAGAEAARLLPGVDDTIVWECPWIGVPPPGVVREEIDRLVDRNAGAGGGEALVLTSFHQPALPPPLLLRRAGVPKIAGVSQDFPGALLPAGLADPPDAPEPLRMLAIAEAAGYARPAGDDGRLAVRLPRDPVEATPDEPFVVVHPGVDAPARAYPAGHWRGVVGELTAGGRPGGRARAPAGPAPPPPGAGAAPPPP